MSAARKAAPKPHRIEDCMKKLGEKYEAHLGAEPGSGQWDGFSTAVGLHSGKERTVLPIWFTYGKKGKRGAVVRRKTYLIAGFCPFCGRPLA